jgi:hypothetical protein
VRGFLAIAFDFTHNLGVNGMRISRQGLSRCPSCRRHIQVETPVSSTVCPFCGGSFSEALTGAAFAQAVEVFREIVRGRTSAVAASVLSLSLGVAGCSSDTDAVPVPVYGITPSGDVGTVLDAASTAPDAASMAPDRSVAADAGQTMDASTPADVGMEVDAGQTTDAEASMDAASTMDAAPTMDADVKDAEAPDAAPVLLYGLPPPQDAGS